MAVDAPARIAILGAGPIGLEAALYARFLGYEVDLYERGGVCENVLRWGHVRLFSPFGMNRSSLGLAALAAQEGDYRPPDDKALLTGHEWAEHYLLPLSRTDLLADCLHERTEVLAVGRDGPLKGDLIADEQRREFDFRLLLRDDQGSERAALADVVIDATGTYGNANNLGAGGIPAVGEQPFRDRIEYGLPDVLGAHRAQYEGQHVLVVGSGYSAATTILGMAHLAGEAPGTQVTWITRRETDAEKGPLHQIPHDPLERRRELAEAANRLARGGSPHVTHWPGTTVEALHWDAAQGQFEVRLAGRHAGSLNVARIVAQVGYRPDNRLYRELQVHECYASGGPMKLAAALLAESSPDCLDQRSFGPESLIHPEPDFYILGSKSYGRNSRFLIAAGLEQIRDLFALIGDRAGLDLYATFKPQGEIS